MPTRSEHIQILKSRGTKGALSKMTKPQLAALVANSEPGHHESANVQQGAGQKHSKYQSFVASHMKQNGGNMAAAAKAYKQQTGSGHCGCDQKGNGRQIQTGKGFWHNLVHEAGKDIKSDTSDIEAAGDDVGHFVKKHKSFIEHAAEIAGGVALLATGPESWGVSGALFGEAAAEGAVDVGVDAAADGAADAGADGAADGAADDAAVAPKPGIRGMVGRMGRNAYGNLKPVVIGSVAGPTVTKDLGMGSKPPPPPTQKPGGDGGAAAYANAQAQQQRGMAYVNNLKSLSQNDSHGFGSGGINPWQ